MIQKIPGLIRFSGDWKVSAMKWIWAIRSGWSLPSNILRNMERQDFQDNFIEQIDFDYLEIQVIEEDDDY